MEKPAPRVGSGLESKGLPAERALTYEPPTDTCGLLTALTFARLKFSKFSYENCAGQEVVKSPVFLVVEDR